MIYDRKRPVDLRWLLITGVTSILDNLVCISPWNVLFTKLKYWIILAISGHFWPFLAISGYFWPFLAISGHFWLFPAIYGHLWPFLAFFWLFLALSGSFRLTYRPTDHQTNRPTDRPTYWFWLFLAILAWSIVLDDHWSKKIYRPKMIVWSGAIIHP